MNEDSGFPVWEIHIFTALIMMGSVVVGCVNTEGKQEDRSMKYRHSFKNKHTTRIEGFFLKYLALVEKIVDILL